MQLLTLLFKIQLHVYSMGVFVNSFRTKFPRYVMRGSLKDPEKPPNYCARGLCPPNVLHIACKSPFWGDKCVKPYVGDNVELRKDFVLHIHNIYRSDTMKRKRRSRFSTLPLAKKLPMVRWDDQLGVLAMRVTNYCNDESVSTCVNTPNFLNVSRSSAQTDVHLRSMMAYINYFITSWFDHYVKVDEKFIFSFPEQATEADYRLANILNEKVTHVGCGILTEIRAKNITYFTCLYNVKMKPHHRVYEIETPKRFITNDDTLDTLLQESKGEEKSVSN